MTIVEGHTLARHWEGLWTSPTEVATHVIYTAARKLYSSMKIWAEFMTSAARPTPMKLLDLDSGNGVINDSKRERGRDSTLQMNVTCPDALPLAFMIRRQTPSTISVAGPTL